MVCIPTQVMLTNGPQRALCHARQEKFTTHNIEQWYLSCNSCGVDNLWDTFPRIISFGPQTSLLMGKQRLEKADIHPGSSCGQAVEPGLSRLLLWTASSNFAYISYWGYLWSFRRMSGPFKEGPGLTEHSTRVPLKARHLELGRWLGRKSTYLASMRT